MVLSNTCWGTFTAGAQNIWQCCDEVDCFKVPFCPIWLWAYNLLLLSEFHRFEYSMLQRLANSRKVPVKIFSQRRKVTELCWLTPFSTLHVKVSISNKVSLKIPFYNKRTRIYSEIYRSVVKTLSFLSLSFYLIFKYIFSTHIFFQGHWQWQDLRETQEAIIFPLHQSRSCTNIWALNLQFTLKIIYQILSQILSYF